ncbi:MAG: sodium-dependent transporter [Myxococcota bacterium]
MKSSPNQQRENWGSRLGFILAAAGSAIGMGALWKLPYTIGQNGGGAFIPLFFLLSLVVGVPLFMAELLVGRAGRRGTVGAFARLAPPGSMWNIGGWPALAAALLALSWYCVVAGWGFHYLLMTLADAFKDKSPRQVGGLFDLFRACGELNVLFQALFLTCTAVVVARGLSSGIERMSRLMTSGLFIMLVGLTLYGATLPGFGPAMRYVFTPDWTALTPQAMLQALGLALFTLSLGHGPIITYGSYMSTHESIPYTSLLVSLANFAAVILIPLAIFPFVFSFGFAPREGAGILFKTLPFVFEQLPGSLLLSGLFFTLFLFAALTSSIAILEVPVTNLMDTRNWSRGRSVLVSCVLVFILGLPTALDESGGLFGMWLDLYGVNFLDTCNILVDWLVTLAALITALFVGWGLPEHVRGEGFCAGSPRGKSLYRPWLWCMRLVVPISIALIVAQRTGLLSSPA